MPLSKLKDFYKNYRDAFNGDDVKKLDLYTEEGQEKIGSVDEVLVDQNGRFRYLVISTGVLGFGKNILLPIGLSRIDYNAGRVFVNMRKDQVERLPEYRDGVVMDHHHEHQIRAVYKDEHESLNSSEMPSEFPYEQNPDLYETSVQKHGDLKMYEDRLRSSRMSSAHDVQ